MTTSSTVRVKMKEAGLYEKFPEDAKLLVDFKKYLTESLKVPNCQREVRSLSTSVISTPISTAFHMSTFFS